MGVRVTLAINKANTRKPPRGMRGKRTLSSQSGLVLGSVLVEKSGVGNDLAHVVLNHVCARDLLKCSMVCKHLRKLVDKFFANVFAQDLLWWGVFERAGRVVTHFRDAAEMSVASWNGDDLRFELETSATSASAQTMWLLNASPAINVVVRMRLQILVPTDNSHVHLSGESKVVQKVVERGKASVDVLEWRIMSVNTGATFSTLTLAATEFAHNSPRVGLVLGAPVMLTVHNVPVQKWTYRCLWVMRGVRRCMYCRQRWRVTQSYDVRHTTHRVLCTHCIEHLYVRESQLARRWRVRDKLHKVPRAHFVNSFMGAPTSLWPRTPEKFLLKEDIAAFFNYASWSEFIVNNHKHIRPVRRWVREDSENAVFMFSSHWFSAATA